MLKILLASWCRCCLLKKRWRRWEFFLVLSQRRNFRLFVLKLQFVSFLIDFDKKFDRENVWGQFESSVSTFSLKLEIAWNSTFEFLIKICVKMWSPHFWIKNLKKNRLWAENSRKIFWNRTLIWIFGGQILIVDPKKSSKFQISFQFSSTLNLFKFSCYIQLIAKLIEKLKFSFQCKIKINTNFSVLDSIQKALSTDFEWQTFSFNSFNIKTLSFFES